MQKSVFKILITLYIPGNFSYFLFIKLTIEIGIKINFFKLIYQQNNISIIVFDCFNLRVVIYCAICCKFDNT